MEKSNGKNKEKGLTLIECLVAIAVIASTIGVIAPITVLAVATRVQNQRAEQAFHIAQSEIDRVRLMIERGGNYTLSDIASSTAGVAVSDLNSVPPPEDINDIGASTTTTNAKAVDINNNGENDFAVQIFRTNNPDGINASGQPVAFELGVRVYKARAVENYTAEELSSEQASLTLTSGEGQGTIRPLSVIYTTIVKSDRQESLCDYYRYIDSAASTPGSCS
ncbi:MAG: prepilin-type N-terminal cleavage/methylation domain-containing protein [Phormidesmis sp.]